MPRFLAVYIRAKNRGIRSQMLEEFSASSAADLPTVD
jgi:hypothetical protein